MDAEGSRHGLTSASVGLGRLAVVVVLIAVGSTAGGVLGATVGRRLPAPVLRGVIVVVGLLAITRLVTCRRFIGAPTMANAATTAPPTSSDGTNAASAGRRRR